MFMFGKKHTLSLQLCLLLLTGMLMFLTACGSNTSNTTSSSSTTPTSTTNSNGGGTATLVPTTVPTATPVNKGTTQSVSITIVKGTFAFSPDSLTISLGTTVVWNNSTGAPHTVTSDDGKTFDSGNTKPISPGGSFSFKFTKAGTFSYHCQFHPFMVATIIVK